ncbi:MAG: hypothetical protein ACAH80_13535 [Alphaproteobacteria bacterium]
MGQERCRSAGTAAGLPPDSEGETGQGCHSWQSPPAGGDGYSTGRKEKKRRQAIPPVEVKPLEPSETPHWAVLATAKALRKARPDKENVVHALNDNHCGISVGVTCVERVISILDVLCCRLEERGLALNPLGKSMGVTLDADSIEFSVVENIEKRKHIPTADELAREEAIKKKAEKNRGYPDWSYLNPERAYPEFDYIRTGKISIQIAHQYTSAHSLRRNWHERKKTIEDQLDEIVSGMLAYIAAVKTKRLEREEWDRNWKRNGRIRELSENYNARENKRLGFVKQLMEDAQELDSFQSLIDRIETTPPADEKVLRMLHWMKNYASGLKEKLGYPAIAVRLESDNLFPEQDMIVEELQQLNVDPPEFVKEKPARESHGSCGSGNSSAGSWFPSKQWYHK